MSESKILSKEVGGTMHSRLLIVLAAGFVSASTHMASAQEVTLKGITSFAEKTFYSLGFERFVEKVNADGKGVIQINYIGGPKAMPPFEVGNALKGGVVDIANVTGAFYTNLMPEADAWKLTERPMSEIRSNGGYAYMAKLYEQKLNAILLARHIDNNPFHVYLTKPISKPDLTGLKFASHLCTAISSRHLVPPLCKPRRAKFTPHSNAAWLMATAGRSPASSISAGMRRPNTASIPVSTARK